MRLKRYGPVVGLLLCVAAPLRAQEPVSADTIPLSLVDAIARALEESEEVRIARAQVDQADAGVSAARSQLLPQVNTQLLYTRTLRSVFQGAEISVPDSLQFEPDSTAPLEDRVSYLEENTPNAAFGALGGLFGDLPFGREHVWNAVATLQQPVFAPALVSGVQQARSAEESARASYEEAEGDVALAVVEAYLGAALAQEAAVIVESSLALAQEHYDQVLLEEEAGTASELDVMRSEVEVENLRPELAQARNSFDLAIANLKRLVNLPAGAEVELTTSLAAAETALPPVGSMPLPSLELAGEALARRASVRAARAQVVVQEERVDIARSAYLPSLYVQGNFGRQAFPTGGLPLGGEWQDDWNVGLAVRWPLFQGFRRKAEVDAARAQVRQAELQVAQLEEGVRLEYETALRELERARLQTEAAGHTVAQAQRVYELTELRYREGLATQLDVSDARLALQQARLNEVTAYHDYYRALARAQRALGRSVTAVVTP